MSRRRLGDALTMPGDRELLTTVRDVPPGWPRSVRNTSRPTVTVPRFGLALLTTRGVVERSAVLSGPSDPDPNCSLRRVFAQRVLSYPRH